MRMLLTSHGIRNDLLRDTLLDLIGKPFAEARIVVVIDAILPFPGDKSTSLGHFEELRSLGWAEFDMLSLFAGPRALVESRLRSADVVLGYGGSNHWLAHVWRTTGLVPMLREILDETVYVGWSAGSMIFSRLHAAAVEAFDDGGELDLFELGSASAAVELLDWFVMPHLGADYLPGHTQEWAHRSAPRLGGPVWFIDDDTALLVRDDPAEPEVISDGHWLRFDADGVLVDSR
jgi:dipeptidase E